MDTLTIILDLLKQKGITDKEFEVELGLNRSSVNDWKAGRTKTYLKKLSQISNYFNVTTDFLLGNEQKNSPDIKSEEDVEIFRIWKLYKAAPQKVRNAIDLLLNDDTK